jgi:hypothetical protein
VGAVRGLRGRLYCRYVCAPEKDSGAAIVQTIETVVTKDAVFILRAYEACAFDGFRSGVARLRNQLIAGRTLILAATRERPE